MSTDSTDFATSPVCYSVAPDDAERPKHRNWVIPANTSTLVDFDSPIRAAKIDTLHKVEAIILRCKWSTLEMLEEIDKLRISITEEPS